VARLKAHLSSKGIFSINLYNRSLVGLTALGLSLNEFEKTNWRWVSVRMKRFVPAPVVLIKRLMLVFLKYSVMADSATGKPLFGKRSFHEAQLLLRHAALGCLSDPYGELLHDPVFILLFLHLVLTMNL
jgi:hypothetical protein